MAVVGVGIDLLAVDRFTKIYGADDAAALERCFTQTELVIAGDGADRLVRLAGRFAAKEAVLKVLGGLQDGISLTHIEIGRTAVGAPIALLSGGARHRADKIGASSWNLSITHAAGMVVAVAVAERQSRFTSLVRWISQRRR